ncbi:unnamed protein product [Larinioides sclopetarius]|uniref:OTU domain-containing protein n=1 Tax=Larinioides sclopetarius TaxID=280406 RepID=A0AAV1ZAW5_9ARAC
MDFKVEFFKMLAESSAEFRLFKAVCNDRRCQNTMYVSSVEAEIECFQCGQRFPRSSLGDIQGVETVDFPNVLDVYLRRMILNHSLPKRGTEMVKVLGLSNYYCKLLSPFLTRYGMDKETGKAKLLKDMNRGDIFDFSSFGDRAFLIEPEHVNIPGFGRDITGSMNYLSETLKLIRSSNGNEERLLPIHTDGDGHCLVHAISRALVGRELFWHPLRCCLKRHFQTNLDKYKELFRDFIDTEEWQSIIDECDPEFKPPEGELHGLRNIHIFGLANVLRRPIILLDSLECMKKCGDYSVPLPVLPLFLLPKVWGMPQTEINTYIEFGDDGNCTIGGCRVLSDRYIQRLVGAMEGQFYEQYEIHPSIVADTKLFLCADNVLLNTKVITVIQKAKAIVAEEQLFRCMNCKALCEMRFDAGWLCRGGLFYNSLLQVHKNLVPGKLYKMPSDSNYRFNCKYDSLNDVLVPDMNSSTIEKCCWCQSNVLMKLKADGSMISDLNTKSDLPNQGLEKAAQSSKNQAGEDVPEMLMLKIQWGDHEAEDVIPDFKLVKKECIVKEVIQITSSFICKHFSEHIHNVDLHSFVAEKIVQKAGISSLFYSTSEAEPEISKEGEMEASGDARKECIVGSSPLKQPITSTCENSTGTLLQSSPTSEPQFVKVVSPNAQAANLTLNENGISYTQLQDWIKDKFSIPVPNQRIKIGFPPKELEAPVNSTQPLPLKHGDRLVVENCPKQITNRLPNSCIARNPARDFSSLTSYTTIQSDVLWNLAKLSPEQFRKGGGVYEEVAGSRILCDMVHFFIEGFPNKTFSYNHHSDSIELCVKPLGHFEITVDLDSRIEQVQEGESVNGYRKCPVMSLKTGHKDPIVNKTVKKSLPSTAQTSSESHAAPLVRKGPGFSILTSPESSERMDIS